MLSRFGFLEASKDMVLDQLLSLFRVWLTRSYGSIDLVLMAMTAESESVRVLNMHYFLKPI